MGAFKILASCLPAQYGGLSSRKCSDLAQPAMAGEGSRLRLYSGLRCVEVDAQCNLYRFDGSAWKDIAPTNPDAAIRFLAGDQEIETFTVSILCLPGTLKHAEASTPFQF